MFFIILGNLEPRPLACAAQGCPVSCPGRGQPWKYLRQRTRPRVTARRCPMRRTPSRRRQFEGRQLAERSAVDGWTAVYDQVIGVTRRCRACSPIPQGSLCTHAGSLGCLVFR